jgi:membrane-bound lytic murein transglycosylase B
MNRLATAILLSTVALASANPKVQALKDSVIARGIPKARVEAAFNDPRFKLDKKVLQYHNRSLVGKAGNGVIPFDVYKERKGLDIIIKRGKDFIAKHDSVLTQAEERYGVPKEYIVAILGMETSFLLKRYKGNKNVFNSVVSHYVYGKKEKRRALFLDQVEALFQLQKRWGIDPLRLKGSFAGAVGYAQFLPTSLRDFFVDSDGDPSKINLYSISDNIHSIANYLREHGWDDKNPYNALSGSYNAIYHYNNNRIYVQGVNYIAERLKHRKPF